MPTFSNLANAASVAGLIFSILAFVQARRASKAAREARDGLLMRTLADELELASHVSEQLIDFLVHGRLSEAALKSPAMGRESRASQPRRSPRLLRVRVPWCASAICRESASPIPDPSALVV